MKAKTAEEARRFTDIPNVGSRIAADFAALGVRTPADLAKRDPYDLYAALCRQTGVRQDPCVLDTFMAAVDFMRGGKPRAWWTYTEERKRKFHDL